MKTVILNLTLTAVEVDDLRRLADRLSDRNGKPLDSVRRSVLEKLRKAAHLAEQSIRPKGQRSTV